MDSLIDSTNHISSSINEMVMKFLFDTHVICGIKLYCINYLAMLIMSGFVPRIEGCVNSVGFLPDERLIPYLKLAGLRSAALIRTFDLRYDLIFALVER